MRDEGEFMVGSIGLCETFWEQEILKHHPDKELLISWVKGVKNETFFNPFTRDNYKGVKIESRLPPLLRRVRGAPLIAGRRPASGAERGVQKLSGSF